MKRARYIGASGTGVDLKVDLPDGQKDRYIHVEQGGLTPETVLGQPFPEELVEQLVKQDGWEPDGWTPVDEDDLATLPVKELAARAAELGLEVTGTGAQGAVVKADLVAALEAHHDDAGQAGEEA